MSYTHVSFMQTHTRMSPSKVYQSHWNVSQNAVRIRVRQSLIVSKLDSNPWCYFLLFGYNTFHPWTVMRCPLNICQLNPKWCSFMDLNFDTLVGKIYIIPMLYLFRSKNFSYFRAFSFKTFSSVWLTWNISSINHHNWSLSATIGNSNHWSPTISVFFFLGRGGGVFRTTICVYIMFYLFFFFVKKSFYKILQWILWSTENIFRFDFLQRSKHCKMQKYLQKDLQRNKRSSNFKGI